MLKKTIIIAALLIGALLAYAATKPDTFHVQRSTNIQAPPDKIFPLIDDFRHQASWSPWEKMDPAMKKSLSGSPSGRGAVYEWDGNSQVGKGRIEITDSLPMSKITMKLDTISPFEAHNIVEFTLNPTGNSTQVTWAIDGRQPYIGKVMGLFMDCDKMIGQNFEAGLAGLKTLAEKA
jgi:carbon monoxide dehydrogenase subunit G